MFPEDIPWWRSRIIVGAAISIICKTLVVFNLIPDLEGLDVDQLSDAAFLVIGALADLFVIKERVVQKAAPHITAT